MGTSIDAIPYSVGNERTETLCEGNPMNYCIGDPSMIMPDGKEILIKDLHKHFSMSTDNNKDRA